MSGSSRLVVIGRMVAAVFAFASPPLAAEPNPESQAIGSLELVASFVSDEPAGVAVSREGRVFVAFPKHYGPVAFTVGEVKSHHAVAYPSAEVNHAASDRPADTLFSVQNVVVDASDHLWLLDTGLPRDGRSPVVGAAKLAEIDLASDKVIRTIPISSGALVKNSALKHVRLDFERGEGGIAYVTDSAPGAEALIVVDLASGRARRRLTGNAAFRPLAEAVPIVENRPLLVWPEKGGAPRPFSVGLNGLDLSLNGKTLIFAAFTGRRLHALSADALTDPSKDDATVAATIRDLGEIGIAGHFTTDAEGRTYVMDVEHNAIFRRTPYGQIETVVASPLLDWPDTMAIGPDQHLYVTSSQHNRGPLFQDGQDLRERPFRLYRVFIGAGPVLRGRRAMPQ